MRSTEERTLTRRRQISRPRPWPARRRWLKQTLAIAAAPWLAWHSGARATRYPVTAAAMRSAQETEMGVYYRYTEFARKAQQDGYRGVAYLFAAFASAELIHATNFGRILARLNVEVAPIAKPEVKASSRRDNLIAAADGDARSVDEYYPKLRERIQPEGHEDAIAAVRFAWSTEQQHREKIRQIQRWSPTFFGQVAKKIDEKTGQYYVCQLCGNTVNAVPANTCPVCKNPSTHFRLIDPPG